MEKTYSANISELYTILEDIEYFAKKLSSDKKFLYRLRLISEEIVVNIINYSYDSSDGKITIIMKYEKNLLYLSFIDQGKQFNPLNQNEPEINDDLNQRKSGGLGIFISKKFSDKIEYKYQNNNNILTILLRVQDD